MIAVYDDTTKLITPFDWRVVTGIYTRDQYDIQDHGAGLGVGSGVGAQDDDGDDTAEDDSDEGTEPVGYVDTGSGPQPVYPYDEADIQQDDPLPGLPY